MTTGVSVLRIAGAVGLALTPAFLRGLGSDVLLPWFRGQRWFGGKGREVRRTRVEWAIPVPAAAVTLTGVDVETADGACTHYQLPLMVGSPDAARPLASLEGTDATGTLVDAMASERWHRWLAHAVGSHVRIEGDGAAWNSEGTRGAARELGGVFRSRLLEGEQSNTSVLIGDVAILKLFRRLEAGENPDVEVGRALGGRGAPAMLGAAWVETDRGRHTSAIVQRQVRAARDAWALALELGRADLRSGGADFAKEAGRIGQATRRLHDALARITDTPAFAVHPAAEEDVARWTEAAVGAARRALSLTAAAGAIEPVESRVRTLATRVRGDAGAVMRHHGDYHLGQVLRDAGGCYTVIDFEGEPARPLEERRRPSSAMRDVAGMMRSFAYAAATLEREGAERSHADAWCRAARASFMTGYLGDAPPDYLPRSAPSRLALLELFEIEKTFYELAYEVENRPSWVDIPMRAVRALAEAKRG